MNQKVLKVGYTIVGLIVIIVSVIIGHEKINAREIEKKLPYVRIEWAFEQPATGQSTLQINCRVGEEHVWFEQCVRGERANKCEFPFKVWMLDKEVGAKCEFWIFTDEPSNTCDYNNNGKIEKSEQQRMFPTSEYPNDGSASQDREKVCSKIIGTMPTVIISKTGESKDEKKKKVEVIYHYWGWQYIF